MNKYFLSYIFYKLKNYKELLIENPIAYRLLRGGFWSLIGNLVSRVFTMISIIIMARFLGKEEYGEMGMVQSTVGFLGVFAGFGLGSTAAKYIAEFRFKDPEKAGRIFNLAIITALASGGLMTITCLVMSSWLATKILNRPDLANLLIAGSPLLFISTLEGVQLAALSGFEAFRKIANINICQGLASPLFTVPCVWFYGVQGAIASFIINSVLGLILSTFALGHEYKKHGINRRYNNSVWREWPILWKFAFPAMLSGSTFVPVIWLTNAMLVNRPDGYGEFGLFHAANQLRMLLIFLPTVLSTGMLPVLSETYGKKDKSEFIQTLSLNLRTVWIVTLPLTVMIITFVKPLSLLFGERFSDASPIISILMIACFLAIINVTVGNALVGSGKMWIGMIMNLGWAIALIMSSTFLIPRYGGYGLAWANLLAYLIHTILVMGYVEFKLARSSVSNQWRLMLFSLIILMVLMVRTQVGIKENSHYLLYEVLLILISLLPLIKMIRSIILRCTYYACEGMNERVVTSGTRGNKL